MHWLKKHILFDTNLPIRLLTRLKATPAFLCFPDGLRCFFFLFYSKGRHKLTGLVNRQDVQRRSIMLSLSKLLTSDVICIADQKQILAEKKQKRENPPFQTLIP